jgi:hypothetical protein
MKMLDQILDFEVLCDLNSHAVQVKALLHLLLHLLVPPSLSTPPTTVIS